MFGFWNPLYQVLVSYWLHKMNWGDFHIFWGLGWLNNLGILCCFNITKSSLPQMPTGLTVTSSSEWMAVKVPMGREELTCTVPPAAAVSPRCLLSSRADSTCPSMLPFLHHLCPWLYYKWYKGGDVVLFITVSPAFRREVAYGRSLINIGLKEWIQP